MSNFISFLIIIVAALIGMKSEYVPNQLLNFGFLIISAYLLSLIMRFFKLPSVLGYILAGVLAGHNGLGFLHEKFLDSMSFVEGLVTMLLVSSTVRFMLKGQSLAVFSKYFSSGMLSSLLTLLLTTGFLAPLSISLEEKIIIGLFAATFSPLLSYAYTQNDELSHHYVQTAFGGYTVAIVLWGILTPLLLMPAHPDRIKLALMPAVISITSVMTGFAWGYIADKLLYRKSQSMDSFFPFMIMFLLYPCLREIGLDYLFAAIGVGVYYGIISERAGTLDQTEKLSLIIFSFFGINLSMESAFLIGNAGWKLVSLITLSMVFSRIITLKLSLNTLIAKSEPRLSKVYLLPLGPLTVITIKRFISGFSTGYHGVFDKFELYSLCTTSMMLTILIVSVAHLIINKTNKTPTALT